MPGLPGHISQDYTDHVSILKFIERNWNLPTVTNRSRDNFPNPRYNSKIGKYVPVNGPAIGDLFDCSISPRSNARQIAAGDEDRPSILRIPMQRVVSQPQLPSTC
jgi:hypothetical protein